MQRASKQVDTINRILAYSPKATLIKALEYEYKSTKKFGQSVRIWLEAALPSARRSILQGHRPAVSLLRSRRYHDGTKKLEV